jgi:valyl-tRNA synthetase
MTDWSKERFTMDKQLSESVSKTFVKLYNDGLVYRDTRLVNWCPALNTALSDIEVDHVSVTKKTKLSVPSYDKKYVRNARFY